MKKSIFLIKLTICFNILSCQNLSDKFANYSQDEIETEQCLDALMEEKGIDWDNIKPLFENYFSKNKITDKTETLSNQYYDILGFFEQPNGKFPIFEQKNNAVEVRDKMQLNEEELLRKKQLDCFIDKYIKTQSSLDEESAYYAFGTSLELCREMPGISPGLIAGGIKASIDKSDLEKSIYQKTIVLMFVFDMTYFLTDTE